MIYSVCDRETPFALPLITILDMQQLLNLGIQSVVAQSYQLGIAYTLILVDYFTSVVDEDRRLARSLYICLKVSLV